jgi:hypothetical protein
MKIKSIFLDRALFFRLNMLFWTLGLKGAMQFCFPMALMKGPENPVIGFVCCSKQFASA